MATKRRTKRSKGRKPPLPAALLEQFEAEWVAAAEDGRHDAVTVAACKNLHDRQMQLFAKSVGDYLRLCAS